MGSAVFKTMFFDAMQHLALYNFNNGIATLVPPPPKKKKKRKKISVASSFILGKVSAQVRLDIFQMRSWAVQSSVATVSLPAVLDFVVTVNSLSLKRFWLHHSACTFLPLRLFFSPSLHLFLICAFLGGAMFFRLLLIHFSNPSSVPVISPVLWKV